MKNEARGDVGWHYIQELGGGKGGNEMIGEREDFLPY